MRGVLRWRMVCAPGWILITILMFVPALAARDYEYYVDNMNGSDAAGRGTATLPWASLRQAITQATHNAAQGQSIAIHLRPSPVTYQWDERFGICLNSEDYDLIDWTFSRWPETEQEGEVTVGGRYCAVMIGTAIDNSDPSQPTLQSTTRAGVTLAGLTLYAGGSCCSSGGYGLVTLSGDCDLSISDCAVDTSGLQMAPMAFLYARNGDIADIQRRISISNLAVIGDDAFPAGFLVCAGAGEVHLEGIDITCYASFAVFMNRLSSLVVKDCVFTGLSNHSRFVDATDAYDMQWFEVRGCIARGLGGGIGVEYDARHVAIENNDLTLRSDAEYWGIKLGANEAYGGFQVSDIENSQVSGSIPKGLAVGDLFQIVTKGQKGAAVPGYYLIKAISDDNKILTLDRNATTGTGDGSASASSVRLDWLPAFAEGTASIVGNIVKNPTGGWDSATRKVTGCHSLLYGVGFVGGEIARNLFLGGDYSMVIKGDGAHVHHNIASGVIAMGIYRGRGNAIINNTLIGLDNPSPYWQYYPKCVLTIGTNQDGKTATGTVLRNNILLAKSRCNYCVALGTKYHHHDLSQYDVTAERNCYWTENPTGKKFLVGGMEFDSLAGPDGVIAAGLWRNRTDTNQDQDSIEAKPHLWSSSAMAYPQMKRQTQNCLGANYIGAIAPTVFIGQW